MNNVIDLQSKRNVPALIKIVRYILSQDKEITIGTNSAGLRLKELEIWFPDAEIQITPIGIKICKKKK